VRLEAVPDTILRLRAASLKPQTLNDGMKIGPLTLDNPTLLAPLAGVTNLPFRLLAREAGCGLVCTEMVSANGLVHGSPQTFGFLRSLPAEKPLAVQIFGSDTGVMAEAAAIVQDGGADVLDINFGCAVRKVVKAGAGAALMRTPKRAEALLRAVRRAVRIPVTIKIRSGWDRSGREALEIGAIAEGCGVDAVTIHPRTAAQKFSGRSDWSLIAALKRRLAIPVIGNGDVRSAQDAVRMMADTGCDAVMIGRRAIGYPRIFTEVLCALRGQSLAPECLDHRLDVMRRYLDLTVACFGGDIARRLVRNRLGWFAKGLRGGAALRQAAAKTESIGEALALIDAHRTQAAAQEKQMPASGS
jgi:nifR3 family TIM-barrel protein